MLYALIQNNTIVQITESETFPQSPGYWIDITGENVSVGFRFENAQWLPPASPVDSRVTRLAFLNRFTDAEAVVIDMASQGSSINAASIRRYLSKVNAATFIDLAREDTRNGVIGLESMGLLAQGRALEILDTPVQDLERPLFPNL